MTDAVTFNVAVPVFNIRPFISIWRLQQRKDFVFTGKSFLYILLLLDVTSYFRFQLCEIIIIKIYLYYNASIYFIIFSPN